MAIFLVGGVCDVYLFSFLCCAFVLYVFILCLVSNVLTVNVQHRKMGGVRVAHLFSFLCCVFCFVCLHFVSCAQCVTCVSLDSLSILICAISVLFNIYLQSNLSYVTFQGNSEIWSHKTGGHLIQV